MVSSTSKCLKDSHLIFFIILSLVLRMVPDTLYSVGVIYSVNIYWMNDKTDS